MIGKDLDCVIEYLIFFLIVVIIIIFSESFITTKQRKQGKEFHKELKNLAEDKHEPQHNLESTILQSKLKTPYKSHFSSLCSTEHYSSLQMW